MDLLMESRAGRQVIFHIPFSSTLVKLLFQVLFCSSAYCESVILDWKILMLGLNLEFIVQLFIFMLLLGCPGVLMLSCINAVYPDCPRRITFM